MKRLLKWICSFTAKKNTNVQVQIVFCAIHGALDIYGIGGTIALLMKTRKLGEQQMKKTEREITHVEKDVMP